MQSEQINLHVTDEISELETVILGISKSYGEKIATNEKVRKAIEDGTYPSQEETDIEVEYFEQVLIKNGINILRPENIDNLCQIFTRDIGFVIDDKFIVSQMKEESRRKELQGIASIISKFNEEKVFYPPKGVYIEGGDIILSKNIVFVGVGRRTNNAAVDFLKQIFPKRQIISFNLLCGTKDPYKDILHLDCAFQPVGKQWALFYEDGFVSSPQPIKDIFGVENLIPVSSEEMYNMFPNIFSLSPTKIISCPSFKRLNKILRNKGLEIIEIPYEKVSLFGGLLRCSTLPLVRKEY